MKLARVMQWGTVECFGLPLATPDDWVAIDTEGTGLDPWGERGVDRPHHPARPFAFSLCNADGETAWVRWKVDAITRKPIIDPSGFNLLQEILGDSAILKVFHNRSYDRRMLIKTGFDVRGEFYDTLIGMHVLNPDEMTYALKPLSKKYLDFPDDDETELHESTAEARRRVQLAKRRGDPHGKICIADGEWFGDQPARADYWLAEPKVVRRYGVGDAERTAQLYVAQLHALDEDEANGGKLWKVLRRELQLADVIARMEDRGICLDVPRTEELKEFYGKYVDMCRKEIDARGGAGLNPKSPKQMCQKFFGDLGLKPKKYSVRDDKEKTPVPCPHCAAITKDENGDPITKPKQTKSGKVINQKVKESLGCAICQFTGQSPKCDAEFLESVRDAEPLAKWMLEYDAAMHMLSSFVTTYLQVKVYDEGGNWAVHPNYKQCGPITGRLSCERPNMMNVASDTTGRKRSEVPYRVRECFIPRPGHVLYLPDYSQIEVWVFAFLSGDKDLQAPLLAGEDFHGGIAKTVWGHLWDHAIAKAAKRKRPEDLTPEEKKHLEIFTKYRKRSKLLMFCKLYGGGAAKVAELLGVAVDEAAEFIQQYDNRLPGVKRYMSEMIGRARKDGYIINPFGRRYPVPRDLAYKATNYMVQGSSAELMKNALIRVADYCDTGAFRGRIHPLLTIHDEIILEAEQSAHCEDLMRGVVNAMQGSDNKIIGCPKPFPVGMKIATERWALTQEIEDL